jgi:hydrogenase maturation protein HypF
MAVQNLAVHIELRGVVQGVGFRPFVYRSACKNGINGWVLNDDQGVTIHAEASEKQLIAFILELKSNTPPASIIRSLDWWSVPLQSLQTFEIRMSQATDSPIALISPDLPICDDCLRELLDSNNRRFLYPYINCTACGPRYSIIRSLPYDRVNTTMAGWQLCKPCQAEYDDPHDRRYHAQPTACHDCGPTYVLKDQTGAIAVGIEAIEQTAHLLKAGKIVAVKGIGGYHLACSGRDELAIQRLRERKFRKEKPFAVMARDIETAREIACLNDLNCKLLTSVSRPIVLAPSRFDWPGVIATHDEVGVMLPYAPLHALLFHFQSPDLLVMTSGNRSNEPIAYRDDDALERLEGIADAFLVGERPIARRVDDSVVAIRDGQTTMVRRSRGYAPGVVTRLSSDRPILAVGADLKNSITLVVSGEAICGQHIGDLGELETDRAFSETIDDLLAMYKIRKSDLLVAHDTHPDFVSTRFALKFGTHQSIAVQHHRAHLASVMAESDELDRSVVGIVLDGNGYGDDGSIWGCEIFRGSVVDGFQHVSQMRPASLPGGDAATRFPVQAAAGFLAEIVVPDLFAPPFSFPQRYVQAQTLVRKNIRCYPTTSAGRLFDTVAALCGFTRAIDYEGQAAIWLEHQAHKVNPCLPYSFPEMDYRPLLTSVIADRVAGRDIGEISYGFHAAVAFTLAKKAIELASLSGIESIAISGGVFQNRLLKTLLTEEIARKGDFKLFFNHNVPTNDGGISLGQAAIVSVSQGGSRIKR